MDRKCVKKQKNTLKDSGGIKENEVFIIFSEKDFSGFWR